MKINAGKSVIQLLGTAILIVCVSGATWAGQKKKKTTEAADTAPLIPQTDQNAIDQDISQMLGAFQVGDINMMHKYYADNATFVSDLDEPPLVGWQNYAAGYERERAAFQSIQLVRRNTMIVTHGDVAWASYQWKFLGDTGGKPYVLSGHTTLVLEKTAGNWLIVHNHTSGVYPTPTVAPQPAQATSTPASPVQPAQPAAPR